MDFTELLESLTVGQREQLADLLTSVVAQLRPPTPERSLFDVLVERTTRDQELVDRMAPGRTWTHEYTTKLQSKFKSGTYTAYVLRDGTLELHAGPA